MNRYIYHYCAVDGNASLSGIAQLTFRITSQADLEMFKSLLGESNGGFTARAISSLSYLGREDEDAS